MPAPRPIIALDADGVLLDFVGAYRYAWQRAFGVLPALKDARAYWAIDRWDVRYLEGEERERLRQSFDQDFWSQLPALPGAVEACERLVAAGYELACVSAISPRFREARMANLKAHGFPIERMIATSSESDGGSPKADALHALAPVAFVDDYLPYFRGIPRDTHAALITREPNGSPNQGDDLALTHSRHDDLNHFSRWWCEHR